MATRTPLILNQTTARIEELAAADTIPGFMVEGMFGRNVLINGDFRVWQRGTNFPAAASARYTADRWFAWAAGSTVQVDRMGADGTSLPPGIGVASRPQYAFRATVASVAGANNFVLLQQRVENVRTLSAGKATFSGLIWASNSSGIAVSFYQIFGTGGSESIVGTPVIVPTVANTWQYVTVTLDVPSIFGTTITDDSALWLNIWLDAGSSSGGAGGQKNGVYWFTNLQLERGASATAFERRSDALELMLCQRYYEKTYNLSTAPGAPENPGREAHASSGVNGTTCWATVRFTQRKRNVPAVVIYPANTTGANPGNVAQNDGSITGAAIENVGSSGLQVAWGNSAGKFGGWFHWTADAEL